MDNISVIKADKAPINLDETSLFTEVIPALSKTIQEVGRPYIEVGETPTFDDTVKLLVESDKMEDIKQLFKENITREDMILLADDMASIIEACTSFAGEWSKVAPIVPTIIEGLSENTYLHSMIVFMTEQGLSKEEFVDVVSGKSDTLGSLYYNLFTTFSNIIIGTDGKIRDFSDEDILKLSVIIKSIQAVFLEATSVFYFLSVTNALLESGEFDDIEEAVEVSKEIVFSGEFMREAEPTLFVGEFIKDNGEDK